MDRFTQNERRILTIGLTIALLASFPAPRAAAREAVLRGADWEQVQHMVSPWRTEQPRPRFAITRRVSGTRLVTELPPPSRIRGTTLEARGTALTDIRPKARVFLHNLDAADGSVTVTLEPNPALLSEGDYRNRFVVSAKTSMLRRLTTPKTFRFKVQHGADTVDLEWKFEPYDGPTELSKIQCPQRILASDSRNFAIDIEFEDPTTRTAPLVFRSSAPDALHTARFKRQVVPEHPQLDDYYRFQAAKGRTSHRLVLTLDQEFSGTARLRVMTLSGLLEVDRTGTISGEPYDLQTCDFPVAAAAVKHYEAPATKSLPRRPPQTGPLQAPAKTRMPSATKPLQAPAKKKDPNGPSR